jgi:hypothetical protein
VGGAVWTFQSLQSCDTIQLFINFALHKVPVCFVVVVVVVKMKKWFVSISRLAKLSFIPFLTSRLIQSAIPVTCFGCMLKRNRSCWYLNKLDRDFM